MVVLFFFILGVPSTLNYIPLDVSSTQSPKLTPYPNWAYNREGNCDGLTTTYRVKADSCNRLWVLDSGTVGIGKLNFKNVLIRQTCENSINKLIFFFKYIDIKIQYIRRIYIMPHLFNPNPMAI